MYFNLSPQPVPIALTGLECLYFAGIRYGVFERNTLDFYTPDAAPSACMIFWHGGGFTNGDKAAIYEGSDTIELLQLLIANGIAVASCNYTLNVAGEQRGILQALRDGVRAIKFLRHNANELNLNGVITAFGKSAGGGIALFCGVNQDFVRPSSWDLVERSSSLLSGFACQRPQCTYDVLSWGSRVFENDAAFATLSGQSSFQDGAQLLFGAPSFAALETPFYRHYRSRVDMLRKVSANMPEFMVTNEDPDDTPSNMNVANHHPNHALRLREAALARGATCRAYIPQLGVTDPIDETLAEFITRKSA